MSGVSANAATLWRGVFGLTAGQALGLDAGLCCLSIDVEEYFHAEAFARVISPPQRSAWPRRAAPFLERLAELLRQHRSRATFFVLGDMVEPLAGLLRGLVAAGHEIACHGDAHEHLARLDARRLREDLRAARARIEEHLGVRPRGYRAPTFSVTRATAWALDVIIEAGFEYDASIFPIWHDRYGVPAAPVTPFWALAPSGQAILEFPPLTLKLGPLRLPVGGGGYLRLLPACAVRGALARRVRRGEPALLYLHPWELDPDQPTPAIGWLARWRHRVNLRTTERKLTDLLQRFRFDTVGRVLEKLRTTTKLPVFELAPRSPSVQR